MHPNWPDIGWASGAFTVFVLPFFKWVRDIFRNFFRDWVLMRGSKAIEGMREAVKPLAARISDNEGAIKQIHSTMVTKEDHAQLARAIKNLDDGQLEILSRLEVSDQANSAILKKISRNGGDSTDLGDSGMRQEKLLGLIIDKLGIDIEPDEAEKLRP